ncbi:TonB-dependent siderophore receptor [Silvibacterium dinghuense]|nr:TonB-dependent siderophore receptor [Silvibacterium dinghuense]
MTLKLGKAGLLACAPWMALMGLVAGAGLLWAEDGKNTAEMPAVVAENVPAGCPAPGAATAPLRRLSGVVTDPSGAGVAHAELTLTCDAFQATATSDAAGSFSLAVPAGRYQMVVESKGFGSTTQSVAVEDTATGTIVNPKLQMGHVTSSVTVTAGNEYATSVSNGGTKTELPLNEVPQSISEVNRQQMDAEGVVTLEQALRNVSGVMAGGYYDNYDYYRIRGFDASFNTYIDGLRSGNGVSEEMWGLESVEVLKGPSSALYGQSPLGGLVNLVTRKPVPANFAHVQLTGGSFNFIDPAVDAGRELNSSGTLYGRFAGLFHSADTFVDYTHRNRYYLEPSLTWRPSPSTQLTLLGRAERDNGRMAMPLPAVGLILPNPNGQIPISRYIGELEDHANGLAQATQQIGYQLTQKLTDSISLHQNARFAWYQEDWNRLYYPAYLSSDDRTLYRYPLSWHGPWQAHEVDTNFELRHSFFGMEHDVLAGLDVYRSPSTGIGYSINFADPVYEPLDLFHPVYGANPIQQLVLYSDTFTVTQYMGVYLQDHVRLPHHITVTAGGRIDFAKNESRGEANQNGTGETPRVGVTWEAIPSTTFYASFSKSYLPQSGSVYNGTTSGSYLPPERGQQWEGGTKSSFWGGRVTATTAIFQLNRNNVATTDETHPNYYVVTGAQRSRGVEFETALHPMTGWNVTAAYSYVNAEVTKDTTIASGTPTLNAPRNILNLWTTYEIPRGVVRGLAFGVGGHHYTDQAGDLENSFQLPGYGLMETSVSYHRGHALWQFNAENLLNERYASGSYNDIYVKPGDPRTLHATMSWNF